MRAQEDGSAGKSMKQNTSGYLLALLAVGALAVTAWRNRK
jgi:hypothetical protein